MRNAQVLQAEGSVARQAPERVALLRYSPSGHVLACQSAGKALELFRCCRRLAHYADITVLLTCRSLCEPHLM